MPLTELRADSHSRAINMAKPQVELVVFVHWIRAVARLCLKLVPNLFLDS